MSEPQIHQPTSANQRVWSRHQDFVSGFPVVEEESIQLGRGQAVYNTSHVLGRDCLVGFVNVAPKIAVNLVLQDDWLNSVVPLPGMGEIKSNGWEMDQNRLIIMDNRNGYTTVGHRRNILFFTARVSRLRFAIAGLAGLHPEDIHIGDRSISLPRDVMTSLQTRLIHVLSVSNSNGQGASPQGFEQFQEADLISFFASVLLPFVIGVEHEWQVRKSSQAIVRSVEDAWQLDGAPPSIAEMCLASGVSERHLRNCFADVYGVSPARYSKFRRISAVRRALLAPNASERQIKDVALSFGFLESGRFASDYRKLFGENPSQTLLRGTALQNM